MPDRFEAVLRTPFGGPWRRFSHPVRVVSASRVEQVGTALAEVDSAVRSGLYAAGFVTYEAAAAFNLPVKTPERAQRVERAPHFLRPVLARLSRDARTATARRSIRAGGVAAVHRPRCLSARDHGDQGTNRSGRHLPDQLHLQAERVVSWGTLSADARFVRRAGRPLERVRGHRHTRHLLGVAGTVFSSARTDASSVIR